MYNPKSSQLSMAAQNDNAAWRIQNYLQQQDYTAAADLAYMQIDNAIEDPRLTVMCLLAFSRAGDMIHAVDLAEEWSTRRMPHDLALRVAQTFLDAGRTDDALAVGKHALERGASTARHYFLVAQALLQLGNRDEEALPYLEAGCQRAPNDLPMLRTYGDMLMQVGRFDDAVAVLQRAAQQAPGMANVQMLYARALKHARRYEEAGAVMLAASKLGAENTKGKRLATSALLQAGHDEEARALYQSYIGERSQKLKSSFEVELSGLNARLHEADIPPSRMDWAWQISSLALGHAPSTDRADWERRARWGYLADIALMDWLECRPETMPEFLALLDDLDLLQSVSVEALQEGKGALFAASHIGPLFAGPLALHHLGLPNRWLSSTPRVTAAAYGKTLISTSDQTEMQVARRVKEALAEGNIVIIAADGAMSPVTPRIQWQGASVTYSDFTALVVYRSGTPSFYTTPYWKADGRIGFAVEKLPLPEPGEAVQQFTARWRDAYFAGILRQVARGPENLRLAGGIWRHV